VVSGKHHLAEDDADDVVVPSKRVKGAASAPSAVPKRVKAAAAALAVTAPAKRPKAAAAAKRPKAAATAPRARRTAAAARAPAGTGAFVKRLAALQAASWPPCVRPSSPALVGGVDMLGRAISRCFPRYSRTNAFAYNRCSTAVAAYRRTVASHLQALTGGGGEAGWAELPSYVDGAAEALARAPSFEVSRWRQELMDKLAAAVNQANKETGYKPCSTTPRNGECANQ
jgi:hypothetical protein